MARLSKKKRIWLAASLLFVGVIVLARDVLIAKSLEIYLSRFLQEKEWTCDLLERQDSRVVLRNVQGSSSFVSAQIEDVSITCHLSLYPFSFQPSIAISGVNLLMQEGESTEQTVGLQWMGLWAGSSFFSPRIQIEKAELSYPNKNLCFVFGFEPGQSSEERGTLWAREKQDEEDFFRANIERKNDVFAVNVEITKASIASMLPWFYLSSESLHWDHLNGKISASAFFVVHPHVGIESCKANLVVEKLDLACQDLAVESHILQGTLSFSFQKDLPIWKQLDLFLTFEEGKFVMNQIGFEGALGEFRLHPEEDPYLKMSGTVISRGLPVPFEIEGKGEMVTQGSCWLQAKMDFFLPHRHPQITASFCQLENGEATLEAEYVDIGKETSDLLQGLTPLLGIPEYRMESGQIQGKLFARFVGKKTESIELVDCSAKDLSVFFPKQELFFKAQEIVMNGLLKQGEIHSLVGRVHRADLSSPSFQIKEITSQLKVVEGAFEPSYIEGSYRGIQLSLQVLPKASDNILHLEGGAYPEDLLLWFGKELQPGTTSQDPIFLACDVSEVAGQARFNGTLRFSAAAEDLEVDGYFPKKLSRKVSDFLSPWNLSQCKGSFQMEKLSASTVLPYLDQKILSFNPQGSSTVQGFFDLERIEINLSAVDLSLLQEDSRVLCALGDQEPVKVLFFPKSTEWEAKIPVTSGFFEERKTPLFAEVLESTFFYKDGKFWTDAWKVKCAGADLTGSLYVDDASFDILVRSCEGDVCSLMNAFKKHLSFLGNVPLQGSFFLEKDVSKALFHKTPEGWESLWAVSGTFYDLNCPLGQERSLRGGKLQFTADSSGSFSIKNFEGWVDFPSSEDPLLCFVRAKDFYWEKGQASAFSLTAAEGSREWLLLEGQIEQNVEGTSLQFSPGVHFLGTQFTTTPIQISKVGVLAPFGAAFTMKLELLPSYYDMAKKMGLLASDKKLPAMKGDLKVGLFFDPTLKEGRLHLNSENFSYEDQFFGQLNCHMYNKANLWKIDSCKIGSYTASACAKIEAKVWQVEELRVEAPGLNIAAAGIYFPETSAVFAKTFSYYGQKEGVEVRAGGGFEGKFSESGRLQGKGTVNLSAAIPSFSVAVASTKDTLFTLDSERGVRMDQSRWEWVSTADKKRCAISDVQKVECSLKDGRLAISSCNVQFSKEGMNFLQSFLPSWACMTGKDLFLQLDAELASGYIKTSIVSKNGVGLSLGEKDFSTKTEVSAMQILWQEHTLYASCQALWNKVPVWLQLKERDHELIFTAKEHPDMNGLSCQLLQNFKGKWQLEAVKGEVRGINAYIQKQRTVDKKKADYDVQLDIDFSKASSILPKNMGEAVQKWKLGRGYQYRGTMTLLQDSFELMALSGEILADHFQCFGKTLKNFRAQVDWKPSEANISGMSLEDETCHLGIKTVNLQKDSSMGWCFSTPLIHVKDFSPSLLVKGKKEGPLIKNMSFYNVKGSLQDWKNTTATGLLNFSSFVKKELSFWDLPLNLIKDLGLDPGLLTPVSGEADFTISQGRCFFTSLKNVCSEGGRSQFELADPSRDSYLALDGSWHVDLQLKQNVVWKMAEDFVLSIRGSIEKPKYSFKRKDSLP